MATQTLEGKIQRQPFGPNTWSLITPEETYELLNPDPQLQQNDLHVRVTGQVRGDIMTIAMIGPVFEVATFERLD